MNSAKNSTLSPTLQTLHIKHQKARPHIVPLFYKKTKLAGTRHPDHPGHQAGRGRALCRTYRQKVMVTARRRYRKTRHTLTEIHRALSKINSGANRPHKNQPHGWFLLFRSWQHLRPSPHSAPVQCLLFPARVLKTCAPLLPLTHSAWCRVPSPRLPWPCAALASCAH